MNSYRLMSRLGVLFALLLPAIMFGQTPPAPKPVFLSGEILIRFDTRTQLDGDKPKEGVTDKYRIKLNVSNSVLFEGAIEALPFVKGTFSNQQGALTHAVECFVINPNNPSQTRNIGRLFGTVPIDADNVYRFADGNLKVATFATGSAAPFESKASGLALGKPPVKSENFFNRIKKEALNIGRSVGGKTVPIKVTNYDKMEFQNHILAGGPVGVYPEVTINGSMIYDYDRSAWLFDGITASYVDGNRRIVDQLSGSVRWIESNDRRTSGKGYYEFNIVVNAPPASEASLFAGPADEAAFFAVETLSPSLTGRMDYKDTIINDTVTQSLVTIDLKGSQINRQQSMFLAKLLLMSSIVPFNSE
jgi:hypothetical protein